MGCGCGKGSTQFTTPPATQIRTPNALAYDPKTGLPPVRREGSVFWDGKALRRA